MKFTAKSPSLNKQLELISMSPPISFLLRIVFLLMFLSFTISFLPKRNPNPTLYTTLTFSPPTNHKENFADISSKDKSQNAPESLQPARRLFNLTDFNTSLNKTGNKLWESIIPSFDCPKYLLAKVGGPEFGGGKDGGKWICGIGNLGRSSLTSLKNKEEPCLVYSFGVNQDSSFEAEVLATTHCEVYTYDTTVDKIGKPLRPSNPRVHFEKLGIAGDDSGDMRTLKTLMQQNGGHKWIDILKMDVEYAEYLSLQRILQDFSYLGTDSSDGDGSGFERGLPFGQLLVEMHVKKTDNTNATELVINLLKRLEENGLRMFYKEINPACGPNWCSEFSFINTNKFSLKRFLGNE